MYKTLPTHSVPNDGHYGCSGELLVLQLHPTACGVIFPPNYSCVLVGNILTC